MRTELVTTLKRQATRILSNVRRRHEPVLITERGRPAAYLVDVETYEELEARLRILEGIARGEKAVRQGHVLSQKQARHKLKRWLK
jgi:prevent-host-death family protein